MLCNITGFLQTREIYAIKKRHKVETKGCLTEVINKFNEHHMRNIFCTNKRKYVIPGETEAEVPPYAVEFCTAPGNEDTYAVADENGVVSLFCDTVNKEKEADDCLRPVFRLQAHNNAIFDIAWVPNEHVIATASGDQSAALWDVRKREVITVFKGHTCSLKSISVSKHNPNLLATGSRDGNALMWDRRSSTQPILRIQDAHVINDCLTPMRKRRRISTTDSGQLGIDSRQTVSSVIFQDNHTVVTAGAMDGMLKIWDLRKIQIKKSGKFAPKNSPKEAIPYPGTSQRRRGYTCLTIDTSSTNLFASCTDDSVYQYNLSTSVPEFNSRQPICKYQGHYNTSFYVRTALSPDGQFLLSGSDDNKSYIWRVDGKRKFPAIRLVSDGMSEVTAVAWCPSDFTKLITCSDECVVREWSLPYNVREDYSKMQDLDGHGEVSEKTEDLLANTNCLSTPTLVVRREPLRENVSLKLPSIPEHALELETASQNLTFGTPPSQKTLLSDGNTGKVTAKKTPVSLDKWLTRTPTQGKGIFESPGNRNIKSRAVKCLENHMEVSSNSEYNKENYPKLSRKSTVAESGTKNKNWLVQLTKRKRSEDSDYSQNATTRSPESRTSNSSLGSRQSSNSSNKTPKRGKTLDMYFSSTP